MRVGLPFHQGLRYETLMRGVLRVPSETLSEKQA
jgi:hypothetical protein